MSLRHEDPRGLHPVPGVLSHAVVVEKAGLVYLSGQIAWNEAGDLVGAGDHGKQAEQIVRNIDTALAAVGTDRSRVVKETIYIADYRPDIVAPIMAALRQGTATPPPAQTMVGVAALFAPEFLVEIDIVAAL
ncbi:RidA family protein [Actinoplanes sp. M2I2]|uniref:RidA family protein n=1 Tax=Actinoplanes sp. M2I2 TaxID=1734444 RepID=UPI00201FF053|nr:RidA family protein [Actinoplanes sp. M2I2]